MRRTFSTSIVVAACLGLASCKGGSAKPIKLIPNQASVIAGVNIKAVMSSPLYTDNKAMLEKDAQAKELLAAAKGCNLDPEGMNSVVFGIDPASENVAIVVTGPGIGKEDNLTCVHGKIKEKIGKDPWTVEDKDGKKVLNIEGGEAVGYLIDDNTLAVASKGWADAVKQIVDGKGQSAVDNSLKDVYAKAPHDMHIWAAGNVPADAQKQAKEALGEEIKTFFGGVDLKDGVGIQLAGGTASDEAAKKIQEAVQKQFDQFKGMAPTMGVPQGVVDSVKFTADGSAFTVSANVTKDDVKTLQDKLGGMMMGGLGGGPPPGAMPPPGGAAPAGDAPPPGAPPAGAAPAPGAPPAAPGGDAKAAPPPAAPPPAGG